MLNALMSRLRSGKPQHHRDPARALYASIVAQARQPVFYAQWGVPDTVEGRFEMIAAHAALVFRRLRGSDSEKLLAQDVFDTFFDDMDGSLREMGVGDIVVPKRIAAMGEALYGRAQAYGEGLDSDDPARLVDAVSRNLIGRDEPDADSDAQARSLAGYLRTADRLLAGHDAADLLKGTVNWPDPTP